MISLLRSRRMGVVFLSTLWPCLAGLEEMNAAPRRRGMFACCAAAVTALAGLALVRVPPRRSAAPAGGPA